MDEIAKLAQVSKPTVSRALNGSPLVNAKTREHVLAIAQKHGYAVNRHAQKLRHNRSNTIAVSIDFHSHRQNHISDPFIFELLAGVSEALGEHNLDLLLTAPRHNGLEHWQQMAISKAVDGFIFLGQGHRETELQELSKSDVPMVVWGSKRGKENYAMVGSNNFLGGQLIGQHFMQSGRRNILFAGNIEHSEISLRYQGLMDVINQNSDARVETVALENFSYDAAYETAKNFFQPGQNTAHASLPKLDAIFAYSDTAAMAFIHVLRELGLSVPDDVAVAGYNDIPTSAFFSPPITTVKQDTYQAGRMLVEKLLLLISGKRTKSQAITTEIVVRKSA